MSEQCHAYVLVPFTEARSGRRRCRTPNRPTTRVCVGCIGTRTCQTMNEGTRDEPVPTWERFRKVVGLAQNMGFGAFFETPTGISSERGEKNDVGGPLDRATGSFPGDSDARSRRRRTPRHRRGLMPGDQRGLSFAREIIERNRAPGHHHHQCFRWTRDFGSVPMGPFHVGRREPQPGDALLGTEDMDVVLDEVRHWNEMGLGQIACDAERSAHVLTMDQDMHQASDRPSSGGLCGWPRRSEGPREGPPGPVHRVVAHQLPPSGCS